MWKSHLVEAKGKPLFNGLLVAQGSQSELKKAFIKPIVGIDRSMTYPEKASVH